MFRPNYGNSYIGLSARFYSDLGVGAQKLLREQASPRLFPGYDPFDYSLSGSRISVRPREAEQTPGEPSRTLEGSVGFALFGPAGNAELLQRLKITEPGIYAIKDSALVGPATELLDADLRGFWKHYVLVHETSTVELISTELAKRV